MNLTLAQYIKEISSWWLNATDVVNSYLKKAKLEDSNYNAFLTFADEYISQNLDVFASRTLKAAPIGVKDQILTQGVRTTCGSKMLENYIPPYSATCFLNMENAWGLLLWKTNQDEFALGSSGENSAYWPTRNPHDVSRITWGTSSGSAAAVAADLCIAALWTDTGWSVRQPSSFCGVVGFKPTYWRVSRYGVQAAWSSLDQVWTITKTVEDAAILLGSIAWHDSKDATSVAKDDIKNWQQALQVSSISNFKIAVPNQYFEEWIDANVKAKIMDVIAQVKAMWAQVDFVDFPTLNLALPVYYIINPAEVSTNLARFDWIRYGYQENTFDKDTIYQYYQDVRKAGFWAEAKRRILVWTYVLSAWYYDAYYLKAQKVRMKLKQDFDKVFGAYDLIIWPVAPSVAWKLWTITDDPLKNYLEDIYTISVNLAWIPAMSLPVGKVEDDGKQMPVGLHILGPQWGEDKILGFANYLEKNLQK